MNLTYLHGLVRTHIGQIRRPPRKSTANKRKMSRSGSDDEGGSDDGSSSSDDDVKKAEQAKKKHNKKEKKTPKEKEEHKAKKPRAEKETAAAEEDKSKPSSMSIMRKAYDKVIQLPFDKYNRLIGWALGKETHTIVTDTRTLASAHCDLGSTMCSQFV